MLLFGNLWLIYDWLVSFLLLLLLLHLDFLLCITAINRHKGIADLIANGRLLLVKLLSLHRVLHCLLRKWLTLSAHSVVLNGSCIASFVRGSAAWSSSQIHGDVLLAMVVVTSCRIHLLSARNEGTAQ